MVSLSSIPGWVLIGLGVVVIIELALDIFALVDLYRRPIGRVALGNKWVWVAIIVVVNFLGAILYLVIGRRAALASDQAARATSTENKSSLADSLYGSHDESEGM
ncbi:MAG: PLDc N-terminal domain-containing protein [Pseudolysinimonas sp.]